jgi:tetratricopeptide (TPR) repeat protein
MLAALIAFILLVSFAVRTLKRGSLDIPWSWLSFALVLLPLCYAVSALFSSHQALSFWGYQLDPDTFGFIALSSGVALLISFSLSARARVFSPFLALLAGSWVVFLFQLIQVFGGAPFHLGAFADPTANLIGSWNEFGIFAGLVVSLSLLALASLPLSRLHHVLVDVTLAVGLFFLVIIDFKQVWAVVAVVAFVMLVYTLAAQYFMKAGTKAAENAIIPGIALALAVFFVFAGGGLATALQNSLHVNALDVRPSLQGTLSVLEGVYSKSPVVGSGPNTFGVEWLLYRPGAVLATPFWGTHFTVGSGSIPTAVAVGGIVVAVAWLILIMVLIYTSVRALIVVPAGGDRLYFLTALAALGALYLALMHILYSPGAGTTLLFFIMLGLLIASVRDTSLARGVTVSFSASPRIGFVAVLAVLMLIVVGLGALYGVGRSYASTVVYDRAISAANAGTLDLAQSSINSALAFAKEDQYYRAASVLDIARLSAIVQSGKNDTVAQAAFRAALTNAVTDANAAVALDPGRYENVLAKADVYGTVVPLKIPGAYDNTITALQSAQKLSPLSPEVDLRIAQAKVSNADTKGAREAIAAAVGKKADYTDAILFLAQIELSDGNLSKAIDSVKAAVYFEPTNSTLLYQLGVLLLTNKNYQDASAAFEAALAADASFANAKFFLAEAYAFVGKTTDAAKLMAELATQNPDNATVRDYTVALNTGKNPFAPTTPPPGSGKDGNGTLK